MAVSAFEQASLFDFGLEAEVLEQYVPMEKKKVKWNPKGGRVDNRISFQEYEGFPDQELVERLHQAILNRSKNFSIPFQEFLEIVSYRKDFEWSGGRVTYMVKIRVKGHLPYATALGVDLHRDPIMDRDQIMFFDYRHLRYEDHPTKPTIFGSVESKTEFLSWAAKGI